MVSQSDILSTLSQDSIDNGVTKWYIVNTVTGFNWQWCHKVIYCKHCHRIQLTIVSKWYIVNTVTGFNWQWRHKVIYVNTVTGFNWQWCHKVIYCQHCHRFQLTMVSHCFTGNATTEWYCQWCHRMQLTSMPTQFLKSGYLIGYPLPLKQEGPEGSLTWGKGQRSKWSHFQKTTNVVHQILVEDL